jgi:hypothetical protein
MAYSKALMLPCISEVWSNLPCLWTKPLSPRNRVLLGIQDEVEKGYKEDLADYEIKPTALKKLATYRDWHGFDSQFGKHINKMLLEVEALDD